VGVKPPRRASGTGPVLEDVLGDGAPTLGKNYTEQVEGNSLPLWLWPVLWPVPSTRMSIFPCGISLWAPTGPEGNSPWGVQSRFIANFLKNHGSGSLSLTTLWVWHEGCSLGVSVK